MRPTLSYLVVSLLWSGLGCTDDSAPSPGEVTVRDSAGVRIVESSGATWTRDRAWRVEPEPTLDIGSVEGAAHYSFGFVRGAQRLTDGRILVLDGMLSTLTEYSPDGGYVREWAGKGEGPGELMGPLDLIWQPGDSVLVVKVRGATLFGPDGGFIREVRLPVAEWAYLGPDGTLPTWPSGRQVLGRLPDGTYVAKLAGRVPRAVGRAAEQVAIVRLAEDGTGDTIVVLRGTQYEVVVEQGQALLREEHFPRSLAAAIGDGTILTDDGRIFGFDRYSPDGRLLERTRLVWPRTVVDAKLRDRLREDRSQYWGRTLEPGMEPGRLQRSFEATPFPDSLPTLIEIRVDRGGTVWTEAFPDADWSHPSPTHYLFASTGEFLGVVQLPARLRVLDIGADYVLGVWRDENDVDFVRLHKLMKGL
jgi:hypothetical protein